RLYEEYELCIQFHIANSRRLTQLFPRSVFAACTFNVGPRTWTRRHLDLLNLAFGWCSITALGNFDDRSGHGALILWPLKLVVRFPAGATAFIPSSVVEHSNIPISNGETCYSVTQYTAGGLFRWQYLSHLT
ncbi:hypothetical protein BD626DRAFT_368069, partial [Schizophyllum amplum]